MPARLLDTRTGAGAPAGVVAADATVELTVTGTHGVPATASAVVVNVTAVDPTHDGYVTVYPCDAPRPNASNLNLRAATTTPNLVIAKTSATGTICLYSSAPTHLLADLNAVLGSGGGTTGDPDSSVLEVSASDAGVDGSASVTGLPDGMGLVEGPLMTAATPDGRGIPTGEAIATSGEAISNVGDDVLLPVRSEVGAAAPEGLGLPQMLVNEPAFTIGSAGHASSVSPAIGRLVMWRLQGGQWYRANSCSGTVVDRALVLTAAHCLRDPNSGRFWDAYSFLPALYGTSMPYGEWFAAGNRAFYPSYFDTLTGVYPHLFDYAFVKFDAAHNNGRLIGDTTGSFRIYQGAASRTPYKFAVGYPAEGRYDAANGGYCERFAIRCYPYFCSSANGAVADFGNGWKSVGFGCNANGGISGGGVFSQIGGTWYVVSVVSQGGYLVDRYGLRCSIRALCNWYMQNMWGPQFEAGYLDALYRDARAR